MEKALARMKKDVELYDAAIANIDEIRKSLAESRKKNALILEPERNSTKNVEDSTAGAPTARLCESRDVAQRPEERSFSKQGAKMSGGSTIDRGQRPAQGNAAKQRFHVVEESRQVKRYCSSRQDANIGAGSKERLKDGVQRPGQCSIGKQEIKIVGESAEAMEDFKNRLKEGAERPVPSSIVRQHVKAVGLSKEARKGAEGRVARRKDGTQKPPWNYGIHKPTPVKPVAPRKLNEAPPDPVTVCDWGNSDEEVEGPVSELSRSAEPETENTEQLTRQDPPEARRTVPTQMKAPMFSGVCALFVDGGVRGMQVQIWKEKFQSFGGVIFDLKNPAGNLTHVLAANENALQKLEVRRLKKFKNLCFLLYGWVQTCLLEGHLVSTEHYHLPNPLKPEISSRNPAPVDFRRPVTEENTVVAKEVLAAEGVEEVEDGSTNSDESENLKLEDKMKQKQAFYGKQDGANLNEHLTNPLAEMWHIYEDVLGDQWRAVNYRKLVNKLRSLQFKVTSINDIKHLEGIGDSLLGKIKEILGTGRLQKLDHLKADLRVRTIQKFGSVWGIGAIQALQYFNKGYREMQDLLKDESLSAMARMGLKYYEEINMRIPRDEVAEVERFLQEIGESLCPGAWVTAAGSFRRGQSTCGDIDILISHPDGSSHQGLLVRLVQTLRSLQFVVDGLNVSDNIPKGGSHPDSFMGICRLQNRPHRRLDIRVYPKQVYAFALLAFTGNDVLNRKIRYLARRKGYKLSDQGLFVRESNLKGAKASTESIPCESEEEIFAKLGLPYPEPHERNW